MWSVLCHFVSDMPVQVFKKHDSKAPRRCPNTDEAETCSSVRGRRSRQTLAGGRERTPGLSLVWSRRSIYAGEARCNKTNAKDLEARRRSVDVPGEGRRATATATHQLLTPCWALDGVCPCMLHG